MSGRTAEQRREEILRMRAERLARDDHDAEVRRGGFEVALVAAGRERFGVPVTGLREILPVPPITRLPGTPPWMLGLTQVRGELVGVVDLGGWLGVRDPDDEPAYLVLVEGRGDGPLGMTVTEVLGFRRVHAEDLQRDTDRAPDALEGAVSGMTRDLIVILDLPRLLERPELVLS